jgi:hypothetical protein
MLPPRYDIAHVRLPRPEAAGSAPTGTAGVRREHGRNARPATSLEARLKGAAERALKARLGHGGGSFDDATGGGSAGLAGS